MPVHKKRYSISESLINPYDPDKGNRWYVWVEHWSGWKKFLLEPFMAKPMETKLRKRLTGIAKRKGAPAALLEQIGRINEQDY